MTSFNEAFKAARKAKGAGATFTWNGKKYTTDYKEEAGKKTAPKASAAPTTKPKPRSDVVAKKGVAVALRAKADKASAEAKKKADAVPFPKLGKLLDGGTTGNKPAVAPNRAEVFKKKKE